MAQEIDETSETEALETEAATTTDLAGQQMITIETGTAKLRAIGNEKANHSVTAKGTDIVNGTVSETEISETETESVICVPMNVIGTSGTESMSGNAREIASLTIETGTETETEIDGTASDHLTCHCTLIDHSEALGDLGRSHQGCGTQSRYVGPTTSFSFYQHGRIVYHHCLSPSP